MVLGLCQLGGEGGVHSGENRDIMCVTEQLVVRHFRGGDTHTHTILEESYNNDNIT